MTYAEYEGGHSEKLAGGGGWMCHLCDKHIRSKLKRHFEEMHTEARFWYRCPGCAGCLRKKRSFLQHISNCHPELKGLEIEKHTIPAVTRH